MILCVENQLYVFNLLFLNSKTPGGGGDSAYKTGGEARRLA